MENHKLDLRKLSNCIRILSADSVEKASSGHPGLPMGFADVMTILAFEFLKFDPVNPRNPNRDRLVLSAGHGSMLLYAFYYLAGYKDFTLDDIKNFRQLHSKTPGHPEYGIYEAVETSTGPLGQGFANSVGMAIAAKKSSATHKIYTIVGDGCLMEGISYEAASLAGHLCLNNMIVLFDDNQITIDGATSLAVSEDHIKKFQALGWETQSVDGHDFDAIHQALTEAQKSTKPHFIACRTQIAYGAPTKAGSESAHGAPLGAKEIEGLRKKLEWRDEPFFIPEDLLKVWRNCYSRSNCYSREGGNPVLTTPQAHHFLDPRLRGDDNSVVTKPPEPTRVSSGKILAELIAKNSSIIAGSADLSMSNNLKSANCKAITKNDYSGNFIHYGVREAAMGAIMNGLAIEGYIPVGGTFLVFSDYMRPSIRLSALMGLKVIYVMTHDSIGVGEDGPTHQPIEHLASLRAIPNLVVMRPADYVETLECWQVATDRDGPSMLILTRQNVEQFSSHLMRGSHEGHETLASSAREASRGAYIIKDHPTPDATIFASGSEVGIAMKVSDLLPNIRVVSIPSFELLFEQPKEYIESLLSGYDLKVGIEAASSFGWERIVGRDGLFFGIDSFGASAPAKDLYALYGLTPEAIGVKIKERLQ
jgi:transketolase